MTVEGLLKETATAQSDWGKMTVTKNEGWLGYSQSLVTWK